MERINHSLCVMLLEEHYQQQCGVMKRSLSEHLGSVLFFFGLFILKNIFVYLFRDIFNAVKLTPPLTYSS